MPDEKKNRGFEDFGEHLALKCLGIVLGTLLTLIGMLSAVYHLPEKFVDYKFMESISISPDSPLYPDWVNPPVPIFMRFYIFNVTNGHDVIWGRKPRVEECGPYTYKMTAPKFNITFHPNDTVSYYNNYTMIFQPDLSSGMEDDQVFHLNTVLASMGIMMEKAAAFDPFGFMNAMIESTGGGDLFSSHTVKEILFGYKDPIFSVLARWSFFTGHAEEYFGFFQGFNNSHDGSYLVNTGEGYRQPHRIRKWNGQEGLQFWSTKYANMINGSDGSFLGTNLTPEDTPYLYFPQMCRSMKLEFERKSVIKGIDTLKFHLAENFLANSSVNPDNAGFCVPKGNCFDSGVLNVKSCMQGAPGFLSLPHFYNAAKEYQNAVNGMTPDKEKHDSVYYAEPKSGAVLKSHRRLQINMLLRPSQNIRTLRYVREIIFPVLWLSGSAEIHDEAADNLKTALGMSGSVSIISFSVIFMGCLTILISLCCFLRPKKLYIYCVKNARQQNGDISHKEPKAITSI